MLKLYSIKFLSVLGKCFNIILLGFCFIPFRILIILEKYQFLKSCWRFINNKLLITNYKIIKFYNSIINFFIFIYLFILIFVFATLIYIIILLLLNFFFFLPEIFACNRMLLFFFIYLTVFMFFCKDDFLDNFFEIEFIDFRKDLQEKPDELYFSFNESLDFFDHEADDYMVEYEWEYDEIIFDDDLEEPEFIYVELTNLQTQSFQDLSHEKNNDFLDNLYFFERWLGISHEILDRIYLQRQLQVIQSPQLKKKI